ncbi:hypothetical protein P3X46_018470 [Hevea brasiliensis]|uniref:C2H2-type domain-containing protein n=1 Tax=Hevea brasiliensis TaxID=3981 RepID=A0ABQ9LQU3_HEVBR|nr:protein SENSITIVE TO PROTON RHIZOTOXICITY 1 [Hevea brasiliensis]XP_058010306.1 protein SENSITIVE TO PROTON RHIZOTOXICITY 1 [Hevea brasiliensis]KAJ9170356.1 hypothetical protein P3X46_018470 [Hevea brasiliensis]
MSNPAESAAFPTEYSVPVGSADLRVSLRNLSTVQVRMDSLQQFLSESVNNNTLISKAQMDMVSAEISSAIHQIIVNGAALLACSKPVIELPVAAKPPEILPDPPDLKFATKTSNSSDSYSNKGNQVANFSLKVEERDDFDVDCDIVELDAVELLAEHVHFCEICGKGFKRDANLRMHMRAHGNQFKTPEALAKPDKGSESSAAATRKTRFSCPFEGCNRNKNHKKFRPLKSVICVRNHFKRSHCPKMYSCNRCNKKSFSVVADLKSHLKHCGETRWKCSCGTTFSRKDKLFGHLALFEGHMPAVVGEDDNRAKGGVVAMEEDEQEEVLVKEGELLGNCADNGFFEGLLDGFASIEGYNLEDVLGSPRNGWGGGMEDLSGIGRS